MQPLTPGGNEAVQGLAQRYRVSTDAVITLLNAVSAGGGSMAQFYHPELGGGGQWMRGGMTMVGDMFNSGLQSTVAGLCSELSGLLSSQQMFLPPPPPSALGGAGGAASMGGFGNAWWPADLGHPSSSGGQNDARYAYFPQARRLAILRNGQTTIHDTLDHQIGGVQQQQGGSSGSLSFSSQFGTFTVDSLPVVSGGAPASQSFSPAPAPFQPAPFQPASQAGWAPPPPPTVTGAGAGGPPQTHADILATLERLSALQQKGILSDDEFRAKKADLLSRL